MCTTNVNKSPLTPAIINFEMLRIIWFPNKCYCEMYNFIRDSDGGVDNFTGHGFEVEQEDAPPDVMLRQLIKSQN